MRGKLVVKGLRSYLTSMMEQFRKNRQQLRTANYFLKKGSSYDEPKYDPDINPEINLFVSGIFLT